MEGPQWLSEKFALGNTFGSSYFSSGLCPLFIPNFTLHTAHFTLHTSHFTLHSAHWAWYISHYTLHTALHTENRKWNNAHDTPFQELVAICILIWPKWTWWPNRCKTLLNWPLNSFPLVSLWMACISFCTLLTDFETTSSVLGPFSCHSESAWPLSNILFLPSCPGWKWWVRIHLA